MGTYVVYKISSPYTDKVYIGHTDRYIMRVREHIAAARTGKPGRLYEDMRTFGVKNFQFEKLMVCRSKLECDLIEAKYIRDYDSYQNGYNTDPGNNPDDLAYFRMIGEQIDEVITMLRGMTFGRHMLSEFDKPVRSILYLISQSEIIQELTNLGICLGSERTERYIVIYDRKTYQEQIDQFYAGRCV